MADATPTTSGTSTLTRVTAMSVYAVALLAWIVMVGLPTDPFQMFVWLWLAAMAWYAGQPWSVHTQFVRDWWPAFVVLVLYLYSRGLSDELIGMPVHWTMPIEVDRWMVGGGQLPTQQLQDVLCGDPCLRSNDPRWYDVLLTTVYFSHFVMGLGLALVLWVRDRVAWAAWLTRYLVINLAGLVVYILYPMAPPWLAAQEGYLAEPTPRLTGRGWEVVGLDGFHVVLASVGNPVAAMPSLHAGLAMLVALWFVSRSGSPWRWATLLYPATMGFALVYYAEHYVIDLVAGWALAWLVMVAVGRWERRVGREAMGKGQVTLARRRTMTQSPDEASPDLEPQDPDVTPEAPVSPSAPQPDDDAPVPDPRPPR